MYYIIENNQESGPYDMVALVRKVKNLHLTPESMVRKEDQTTPVKAHDIPEVAALFEDAPSEPISQQAPEKIDYDLKTILQSSMKFLQLHHQSVMHTGIFLIVGLVIGLILWRIPLLGPVLASIVGFILYAGYQFGMLKLSRGQALDGGEVIRRMKTHALPLALTALTLCIPVGLGLVLLLAPGLLILTFYIFTPLLIIEKNLSFWAAMEKSRKKVASMGANNIGVLFALVVANLFGVMLLMLPLLITLPMTANAVAEIFDDQFTD